MKHTYRPVSSKTSDPQTSDKAEGDDETRPPQRLLPPATREVQKVVPLNSGGQQIASNTSLHEKKPTRENEQRIRQDSTVDFSEFTFISDSAASRSDQIVETGQPELTYRDKSVICHFCQICFEKSHDFYHHANLKHREAISKTWRLCQKCLWHFPTKKSLSNHGCDSPSTSTLEVPQRCQFCAFTFASLSSEYFQHANKAHLKIISKAGWITCPICHLFCPDHASLETHQKDCHRDDSIAFEVEDEETNLIDGNVQVADEASNLADDDFKVKDEARIYVMDESAITTIPTEDFPSESSDVEITDLKMEEPTEPVEDPVVSCPLCRLDIKKTDSDITQHLFEAHGTYETQHDCHHHGRCPREYGYEGLGLFCHRAKLGYYSRSTLILLAMYR